MTSPHARTNRLANESSPYLRQHAHNPVDWYPWGPEALAKAKAENKPILLSVGYSACHWCHVMAHECFENEAIAAKMNGAFVNIKVDREERPDVDEVYQRVTQIISGQGGWPLTVFLDPEGKPVYGGTYFPPDDKYGRPSFPRVIDAVLDAIQNRPDEAASSAKQIVERMRMFDATEGARGIPARSVLANAAHLLKQNFDVTNGGFGGAPKFPMVADMELLLAEYRGAGDQEALDMVLFTLQKMAVGGIYDQLGGGFHRYSVDPIWLVPHFEKMLYDNALLPRVYLEAYRLTKDGGYARIATETLNYLLREMRAPDGGFYSAQDADSEGEEGKFFVWTLDEVKSLLGAKRGARFAAIYDVTHDGNWEHKNILRIVRAPDEVAQEHSLPDEDMAQEIAEGRRILLAARDRRIKPGRDDKRITAWNGLALSAFARAGALLEHPPYLEVARETASFILERCFDASRSRLRRIFHADEGQAKIDGFLDDYAYAAIGLLDLHRATGEVRWGREAVRLLSLVEELFYENGVLYLTPKDGEALPARPRSGYDQMLPSPASAAVEGFWRAYVLTDKASFREAAERALGAYGHEIESHPTAFAGLATALDLYHRGQTSCVVTGELNQAETLRLGHAARRLLPNDEAVLLAAATDGFAGHLTEGKRTPTGAPAAFVCQGYACQPPAMTPDELAERLKG